VPEVAVTKDFDVERVAEYGKKKAATFSLGGEKFTLKTAVSAEVLAEFGRREVAHYGDALEAYDKFIVACLDNGDGAKWDKVRKEANPPLTVGQVESVLWWIMDEVADRPTAASSPSRPGRGARQAT
jgi:hypothetical protein